MPRRRKTRDYESPCPTCGAAAYYLPAADVYCHADGSQNLACWIPIRQGRIA